MAGGATVTGERELVAKLKLLARQASAAQLAAALNAGALLIETAAKVKAPVLTGTLRSSIHTETAVTGATSAEARTGTDIEYGPYVELGTRSQRPQPYLRPAYDENRARALAEIGDALQEMVQL